MRVSRRRSKTICNRLRGNAIPHHVRIVIDQSTSGGCALFIYLRHVSYKIPSRRRDHLRYSTNSEIVRYIYHLADVLFTLRSVHYTYIRPVH